jgi:hypothetical protein
MDKAEFIKNSLKANAHEQFVFDFIVNRFDYYDCYYGNFIQYQPELQWKEYSTLKDDLKLYHTSIVSVNKSVNVKDIQSLKRSFELLRGKIAIHKNKPRKEFILFLDFCIQNLDSMVDRFIDEILSRLQ